MAGQGQGGRLLVLPAAAGGCGLYGEQWWSRPPLRLLDEAGRGHPAAT